MITTKDILDKFNDKWIKGELDNVDGELDIDLVKQFLQSNLNLMLESMEREALDKIPSTMKRSRREVINIINSHKNV